MEADPAHRRATILCLGEAIVDLICEERLGDPAGAGSFRPHPGGALANVAVAAARGGAPAALLGGVGADPFGRWMRAALERERVDTRWLATVDGGPTPVAIVTFDRDGEPEFHVYGEGIEATMLAAAAQLGPALDDAGALIFGSNTLVGAAERELTFTARDEAVAGGLRVLFDPNLRPNRWERVEDAAELCRSACAGAFLVKATSDEGRLLTGNADPAGAAEEICALGAELAVITRGAAGAVMRGAASAEVGAPEVDVVSPLGAGDAFMGAMAASLAAGEWRPDGAASALAEAARAGAEACEGWGAYR